MVSFSFAKAVVATLSLASAVSAFVIPEHALEKRDTLVTIPALDGTGCPKDTSNITISANTSVRPTNITIEVTTNTFSASISPFSDVIERQRNCVFLVQIGHLPPDREGDYQYTVTGVQVTGTVDLSDKDISGSWTGLYYFASGNSNLQQKPFTAAFTGPVKKPFVHLSKTPAPAVYSTCGRTEPLAIVNTIAINSFFNEQQSGFIGSAPSGFMKISLALEWKKCTK